VYFHFSYDNGNIPFPSKNPLFSFFSSSVVALSSSFANDDGDNCISAHDRRTIDFIIFYNIIAMGTIESILQHAKFWGRIYGRKFAKSGRRT